MRSFPRLASAGATCLVLAAVLPLAGCESDPEIAGASSKPGGGGNGGANGGDDAATAGDAGGADGGAADTGSGLLTGDPRWRLVDLGENAEWRDLGGYVRDDETRVLTICGTTGVVGLYDGKTPTWRNLGIATNLNGVWARDDETMIVVGEDGLVRHYDPETGGWTEPPEIYPNLPDFVAIGASGPADVYAGGVNGLLWHFDGIQWSEVQDISRSSASPATTTITDIFVEADGTAWLASGNEVIWGKGFQWDRYTPDPPFKLEALHGAPGGPLFAVGYSAKILHYQDGIWTLDPIGIVAPALPGVFAWAPDGAIAVTRNKTQPLLVWRMLDGALTWDRVREDDALAFTNTGKGNEPINATALELGKVWAFGPDDITILAKPVSGDGADLLQFGRYE